MTARTQRRRRGEAYARIGTWLLLCISVCFCAPIADGVRRGLSLCAEAVVPSVLPSMLLSDLLLYSVAMTNDRGGRVFRRCFKLPPIARIAFFTGLLTGFPMGVRMTAALYQNGSLTKEEAERLLAFVGNTGPAFLIAGVGAGLYGRIWVGIVLYATQLIGAVLIGLLFSRGKTASQKEDTRLCVRYSFTESVRAAGEHTVTLCAFVCLFSAISELLMRFVKNTHLLTLILPWLEVSCATAFLSSWGTPLVTLPTAALAVGFSGLSVHAQSMAFIKKTDLNPRQYWIGKLMQGGICFALVCVFCYIMRAALA